MKTDVILTLFFMLQKLRTNVMLEKLKRVGKCETHMKNKLLFLRDEV